MRERQPTAAGHGRDGQGAENGAPQRRQQRRRDDERQRQQSHRRRLGPGRPVGTQQGVAVEDLLDQLRLRLDARRRRIERRRDDVRQQRRAGADDDDLAGEIGEIGAGLEQFPRRRRQARIRRGEISADVAGGFGRHDQVADLDRRDAGALPRRRTAEVGRLDQIGRGALRDPQALDGEARLNLTVDDDQQRHAAHHPVRVRLPVNEADSRGALGQNRQRPERAVEMRQIGRGVLADEGESALGGNDAGKFGLGDELAQDDGLTAQRLGESRVALRARRPPRRRSRRAIRLRKQYVEADRRRLRAGEGVDELRHLGPRPRPLAQPPDQLVVDVDDAHESLGPRRARPPALVLIEDDVLEIGAQRRQRLAERERARIDCDDDQQITPVPFDPPRRGLAPGPVHGRRAASAEQRRGGGALGPLAGAAGKPPIPRSLPIAIRRGASDQAPSSDPARARASFNACGQGRGLGPRRGRCQGQGRRCCSPAPLRHRRRRRGSAWAGARRRSR